MKTCGPKVPELETPVALGGRPGNKAARSTPSLPDWLPRRLMNVDEVAEVLDLSPRQVWRLIAKKKLKNVKIGRTTRVTPEAVAELIADQE